MIPGVQRNPVVRSEVTETCFNLYSDHEKKEHISVCPILSQYTLDAKGSSVSGGLYDPRMGPMDQHGLCHTCGMRYVTCPGHMGHIELDVPVYNPLLFASMFQLLRSKCVFCHKLRLAKERVRYYVIKLKLIEMGDLINARNLDDLCLSASIKEENESETVEVDLKNKKNKKSSISTAIIDVESNLKLYEERYDAFVIAKKNSKNKMDFTMSAQQATLQSEIIEEFKKVSTGLKSCENCGQVNPTFRKDGFIKIFQKPIKLGNSKNDKRKSVKIKSALDVIDSIPQTGETPSDDTDDESLDPSFPTALQDPNTDKYLVPIEVEAQIKLLWGNEREVLDYIWRRALSVGFLEVKPVEGSEDPTFGELWRMFFMRIVLVPPSRFRTAVQLGDMIAQEHPQNVHLKKIMEHNLKLRLLQHGADTYQENPENALPKTDENTLNLSKIVSEWIELQDAVNCYTDAAKSSKTLQQQGVGIRQLLERKEGLFRRHMMGKRVNYCCRSVISPDPYIGTNEIGIPVHFAQSLHYPEPVNDWNVRHLRTLVEKGANEYPGANQIETGDGRIIKLDKLSAMERAGKAKLLLSQPGTKVYRHLVDGDVLLVNRQPTLHKPGVMAHKARVLKHVREQTLRMNYANCNTYNADFDGDEMNCHFLQNELARAEATYICNTDNQYIVPTDGSPIRGLIQDHVASGVKLTCKDTFLDREQFQQLLYVAVSGLAGTEVVSFDDLISLPIPAVLRPKPLWTGKQVISSLLAHLCRPPLPSLHLNGKSKTPAAAMGEEQEEHLVLFRHGQLLRGVLDKASMGSTSLGIVHAVYELYGAELTGLLLNAFGRVFTYFLQDAGHTCGIQDLLLTKRADSERVELLARVKQESLTGLRAFLEGKGMGEGIGGKGGEEEFGEIQLLTERYLAEEGKEGKIILDGQMQSVINSTASLVIKACLPNGLEKPFLQNNFSMMVMTGAKGSGVNQSQISCFLGQQVLEGQRVPIMPSGKSLPAFLPYDPSVRAGGFVQDRFLTGVKPQEYYFHCMAGREGLVDTAVKTSRSGYLQRCLVKHLEELKVHYDMTVRDSGNNVIQFLYGEDGLDPVSAALLGGETQQMQFLAQNNQALVHKYSLFSDFFKQGLEIDPAVKYNNYMKRAQQLLSKSTDQFDFSHIKKGVVILARQRINSDIGWERSNLKKNGWFPAEVVKVRIGKNSSLPRYDLVFENGKIEKKVPAMIWVEQAPNKSGKVFNAFDARLPVFLVKIGLPDPCMSNLPICNTIGACSEKIQNSLIKYTKENPDNTIVQENSVNKDDNMLSAEAMELLVWVKYMRSLACPGEAVGCVAAQSVGEPSTQMTLNTFHLAGHGGANVTLGIPRLREIIMTASKSLKTPTMTLPMKNKTDKEGATALARKLSRLPLSLLLSHNGGVEVGEQIRPKTGHLKKWERCYRVKLYFEDPVEIEKSFQISFQKVVEAVKKTFLYRLDILLKTEQRRAGENVAKAGGKNDPLKMFRSAGTDSIPQASTETETEETETEFEDKNQNSRKKGKKNSDAVGVKGKNKNDANGLNSDEDDSDDDDEQDNADDLGNLKLQGGGKEVMGYEDENENEEPETTAAEETMGETENERETENETENEKISKPKKTSTTGQNVSNLDLLKGSFVSNMEEGWVQVEIPFPVSSRRFLMTQLAEKAAKDAMVLSTPGIVAAHAVQLQNSDWAVQTEGVNFEAVRKLPLGLIEQDEIKSNDIWMILQTYGVEAARSCIVSEITGVFEVYGITVDRRHLNLIADFMTKLGGYTPLNRIGMLNCPSPFQQMSFETSCNFLTKAAVEGGCDIQESPSARIVLGSVAKVGTGCFDLMLPLQGTKK